VVSLTSTHQVQPLGDAKMTEETKRRLSPEGAMKLKASRVTLTREMYLNEHEDKTLNRDLVLSRIAASIGSMQLDKEEWSQLAVSAFEYHENTALREYKENAIAALVALGKTEAEAKKFIEGAKAK
jgi:hypothetical protein